MTKPDWATRLRHLTYAAGWKKFEGVWYLLIRAKQISRGLPALEAVLRGFGTTPSIPQTVQPPPYGIKEEIQLFAGDDQWRCHSDEIADSADDRALLTDKV